MRRSNTTTFVLLSVAILLQGTSHVVASSQEAQLSKLMASGRSRLRLSLSPNGPAETDTCSDSGTYAPLPERCKRPPSGGKEADRIKELPGQPPRARFGQYSGYVTVNEERGRELFYYFVESPADAASKPLILWLNGGPGCSSLGYGAMMELGPFRVNPDGETLSENKHAWNSLCSGKRDLPGVAGGRRVLLLEGRRRLQDRRRQEDRRGHVHLPGELAGEVPRLQGPRAVRGGGELRRPLRPAGRHRRHADEPPPPRPADAHQPPRHLPWQPVAGSVPLREGEAGVHVEPRRDLRRGVGEHPPQLQLPPRPVLLQRIGAHVRGREDGLLQPLRSGLPPVAQRNLLLQQPLTWLRSVQRPLRQILPQ
uniref:Uncharacterized protein n=1 Tax=Zea mays TaxID=4577 RepID=C0PDX6_MAIZE|nr:unknown [Zea mays]|eukprot:NP_001169318.1 uncharacterized protein LOC100383183 precursor [Zea mays]